MTLEQIYQGPANKPSPELLQSWLEAPPPWRDHLGTQAIPRTLPVDEVAERRGAAYVPTSEDEVDRVNLALWLRRPLLVTGPPGIGKSSLAYAIATGLGLGAPLRWEINSQSTLVEGLYAYDAIGHFHSAKISGEGTVPASEFIRLGPLGTAFVPTDRPRVLLVDELDKASWDLPNDLLHVFEEGAFTIPELARQAQEPRVQLEDSQSEVDRVQLAGARVTVRHHPIVVITSNAEREFSEAFRRRCVSLSMSTPNPEKMAAIVRSQLGTDAAVASTLEGLEQLETDIVLQIIYAMSHGGDLNAVRDALRRTV